MNDQANTTPGSRWDVFAIFLAYPNITASAAVVQERFKSMHPSASKAAIRSVMPALCEIAGAGLLDREQQPAEGARRPIYHYRLSDAGRLIGDRDAFTIALRKARKNPTRAPSYRRARKAGEPSLSVVVLGKKLSLAEARAIYRELKELFEPEAF